jgi:hypothetical protein
MYLSEIGMEKDLKICAEVDSIPVLPLQQGTVIKLRHDNGGNAETAPAPQSATNA